MQRRHWNGFLIASAAVLSLGSGAQATLLTSSGLTEAFNTAGMPGPTGTTPPTDWTNGNLNPVVNQGTGTTGVATNQTMVVNDGSTGTAGTSWNLGTTNATDRALGSSPTTSSGDRVIEWKLTNGTGAPITSFTLTYTGEEWRQVIGTVALVGTETTLRTEGYDVLFGTANNSFVPMGAAFKFTAPKTASADLQLDGNAAANRATISQTYAPTSPIAPGADFYLRWFDFNDQSKGDDVIGIDDVTITVPEPASLGILGIGSLGLLIRRRRIA